MAADAVCERLRIEFTWVVKAGRVDRNQFRHCGERKIDRRSTNGAEGMDLFVPASARYPPAFASPDIVTSTRRGNVRQDECPVPLRFWQSKHWQWFSKMGFLLVS